MGHHEPSYEIIFSLRPSIHSGSARPFCWSWVKISNDGVIMVRGQFHGTLRAAVDAATEYRRQHGGGPIRVNIHETRRKEAQNVVRLG